MKKYIVLLLILSFSFFHAVETYAITWVELITPLNKRVYLDLDSITFDNQYCFYNIKVKSDETSKVEILTIQSSKFHSFSSSINKYTEEMYENLNGDYDNIKMNMTKNLGLTTYDSIVNTCHKRVLYELNKDNIHIEF